MIVFLPVDVPGTEFRTATISGNPDACGQAHRMVMDIINEVLNIAKVLIMQWTVILLLLT